MKRALGILVAAIALLLVYPLTIALEVWQQSRTDEIRRADAIVVLGAAQYDGRPSPVFKARLDHASYLYREGLANRVIVTGGKQPGDRFTEAEAGAKYLGTNGVPKGSLMKEPRGLTTLQSLRNVQTMAREEGIETLLLVSDPMHSERLKRITRDLGFEGWVSWAGYMQLERSRLTKAKELGREVLSIMAYEVFGR